MRASDETRIKRVMQRDKVSENQAKAIIASQPMTQTRRDMADVVIENTGDKDKLELTVNNIVSRMLV